MHCVLSDLWLLVSLGFSSTPFGHFMKVLLGCQKPFFKIGIIWEDVEDTTFSVCLMKEADPLVA